MNELLRRWGTFFSGLSCMGLGVAMTTNAQLGTTPITSLPLVCAELWHSSLGACTFGINVLLFLAQFPLLGKKACSWKHCLQLPSLLVFASFIDIGMWATHPFIPEAWLLRALMCLLGCLLLAFGVMLEIYSGTTVIPGEGLVVALAWRYKKNVGNIKVLLDSSLVIAAALLGLLSVGAVLGIREGTLASALLTGIFVRFFAKLCASGLNRWLAGKA
jgi:uncharacterized protein